MRPHARSERQIGQIPLGEISYRNEEACNDGHTSSVTKDGGDNESTFVKRIARIEGEEP